MPNPDQYLSQKKPLLLRKVFLRCESLGIRQIKGLEKTVQVFQVIATSRRSTQFEVNAEKGLSPFVGREREIELLLDGFERAKTGRGQAFSIVAEAGVGKTRLVYEFRKAIANENALILEGRCLSFSQNESYHPVVDVLKSIFNILDGDGEVEIKEKARKFLKMIDADTKSTIPYLLELLKVKDSGIDEKLNPEERKSRFIRALKHITLKGSEVRPTVLIIEDLHWMDESSEEAFKSLFEDIAGSKVLLIFTYRPEYIHVWGAKTYHSQINLNRLSNRESLFMISHLLQTDEVDSILQDLILEKAEGVPFFIEELIKSLIKLDVIQKRDNRYQLARHFQEVAIPSTIQDVIMARVDALPARAKEVIQAGSAIEREFSYDLIKQIVDMNQDELLSNLSVLKDLELIYERGIFPKSSYIFKHALTQEVVYNSILKNRAKIYHEKIGQAIEKIYDDRLEEFYEILSHQYSKSESPIKAYEYLKLAGDKACRNYSNKEAFYFYKEAIQILKKLPETKQNKENQVEISKVIYGPMMLCGFPEGSLEILHNGQKLSKELGNRKDNESFCVFLGSYYAHIGNAIDSINYAEPLFKEAQKNNDIELMAQSLYALFPSYMAYGYYNKIADFAPDVIKLLEKSKKEHECFGTPNNIYSWICLMYGVSLAEIGDFEKSLFFIEKGHSFAVEIDNVINLAVSECFYGIYHNDKGDGKEAIKHFQKSTQYGQDGNYPWLLALNTAYSGLGYWYLGDLYTAKEQFEIGQNIHRNTQVAWMDYIYPLYLSFFHHDLGDYVKAQHLAEMGLELSKKNINLQGQGITMYWLGRIIGKRSPLKNSEAEKYILQGIQIFEELKLRTWLSQGYFFLGELYANTGRKEEALQNLNKALSMYREMENQYWPDKIKEVLDRL